MLNDEQINARIRSLNKNQIETFDIVLDRGKFIQNSKCNNPTHFEPIRMFLRSAGGAGKYHLIKCICNCLSKNLVYNGEELEKPRVIKIAPTRIASINIEGKTIHTALNIPINDFLAMSNKKWKILYVYLIIFDEISLVSPKFLLNINNYFKFSEQ